MANGTPVIADPVEYSEWYRQQLVKNFGDAEPAVYDDDGNCELCGEDVKCPGWHAPAEEEGDLLSL